MKIQKGIQGILQIVKFAKIKYLTYDNGKK